MATRRVVQRDGDGEASSVNAAIAVNIGRHGRSTSVSSRQRIVQRDGRVVVHEHETQTEHHDDQQGAQS